MFGVLDSVFRLSVGFIGDHRPDEAQMLGVIEPQHETPARLCCVLQQVVGMAAEAVGRWPSRGTHLTLLPSVTGASDTVRVTFSSARRFASICRCFFSFFFRAFSLACSDCSTLAHSPLRVPQATRPRSAGQSARGLLTPLGRLPLQRQQRGMLGSADQGPLQH